MTRFNIKGKSQQPQGSPGVNTSLKNALQPQPNKPRVVISANQGRRQGGGNIQNQAKLQVNQITQLRDKSLKSDKWNLFVGEDRYKTNFMLQFKDRFTKILYEKNMMPNSIYSLRLYILLMVIFDIFFFGYEVCQTEGCFLIRCLSLVLGGISLFGTFKQAQVMSQRARKLIKLTMPIYWSLRILQLNDGTNEQLVSFLFYIPTYLMSIIIIADWLEYLAISTILTLVLPVFYKFFLTTLPELSLINLLYTQFKALTLYVICFALQEKIRKEQFIIGYTNSQTKKLLLGLFNAQPSPFAIVGSDGQIQFCNQPFEQMLQSRLNIRQVPPTIFKLTSEDDEATSRLKQFIVDIIKPSAGGGLGGNMTMNNLRSSENSYYGGASNQQVIKKIEIKLTKGDLRVYEETKKKFVEKAKEETKTSSTLSERTNHQKDLFEKYEIAQVQGESVNYLSKKAIMLTFNIISEQKAKNRLIYLHSQLMYKFLYNFNRRLIQLNQQLASKPTHDEDVINNSSLVEFLGSTYVAINQVQQIQHEFWMRSENYKVNDENFLLKEEIMQCVESLSVKCLNPSTTLKLDASSGLPEKCVGDVQRFRLALQAVSEFAMKYCVDGIIEIQIRFDSVVDTRYLIAFDFVFSKNASFNEEPLINLLNSLSKSTQMQMEDLLLKNYEDLFDLISQFGIGMLIFPGLIANLDGSYQISAIDSPVSEQKEEEKIPPFEGEQDQAHPVSSNKGGKIKILFKIPFSQGEVSKRVMSPYTPINKTKSLLGNAYILKSPNIATRETRKQALSQVRQLMDGRSPLINAGGAGLRSGSIVSGVSNQLQNYHPFKQNVRDNIFNNNNNNVNGSNFLSDNNNQNNLQYVEGENSFCNNSHHLSNNLNSSNNKNRKNSQLVTPNVDQSIVKRVENKLKNLESKHPQQANLFHNQNITSHREHQPNQNAQAPVDEKSAMELTNSRKSSQQVLPSNAMITQKVQELAPLDAYRIQSMNYIANGFSSNNLPGQGANTSQFNSNKQNAGSIFDLNGNHQLHHQSSMITGNLSALTNQLNHAGSSNHLVNSSAGHGNDSTKNLKGKSNSKKKKPSPFIKINHLDEESEEPSSRMPAFHSKTENTAQLTNAIQNISQQYSTQNNSASSSNQNSMNLNQGSGKRVSMINTPTSQLISNTNHNVNHNVNHNGIGQNLDKLQQRNLSQIVEQQQQFEEDKKIEDRDKELDNFLLTDQDPGAQDLPVRSQSRSSSKSFRVARTFNPNEIPKSMQLQKIPHEDIKNQDSNMDDMRKVLSFGQGLSARGNRQQLQNQYQNLQNFFVQNNVANGQETPSRRPQHGDNQAKSDLSATVSNMGFGNMNQIRNQPLQESELGIGTPNLRQNTDFRGDQILDDREPQDNDGMEPNQDQSQMRFGNQSPITLSDGLENFDSNDISEDDNTSEILAVLSHNLDDQEEQKVMPNVQSNHKNRMIKDNSGSYSKLDNSFDKVSQNLYGSSSQNKLQVEHRRSHSKTRRLNSRVNKHEPLSKHIPKDILSTHHVGASKNLLSKELQFQSEMYNASSPEQRRITPDQRPNQPSLIYDDPILNRGSFGQQESFHQPRFRESYGLEENFCPYRRGKKTLEFQHSLKKDDYTRLGSPSDPTTHGLVGFNSSENNNPQANNSQANNSVGGGVGYTDSNIMGMHHQISTCIRVWNGKTMQDFKEAWEKIIIPPINPKVIQQNGGSKQQLPFGLGARNPTYRDDTLKYVLVAEDNLMISSILEELLKSMNYTPIIALNGRVAVEKFTSFMKDDLLYDLILMDIYMPEMNGYEATKAIRQIEESHSILGLDKHFICGFSAEKNDAVLKKCLEAGMNDLYDKTISKDILTELLKKSQRPPKVQREESHSHGVDRLDLTLLPGMISGGINPSGPSGNLQLNANSMNKNI